MVAFLIFSTTVKIKRTESSRVVFNFFHDFQLHRHFESSSCQILSQGVLEFSKSCWSSLGSPFRKPNEEPARELPKQNAGGITLSEHCTMPSRAQIVKQLSKWTCCPPLWKKNMAHGYGKLTCCKRKQDRTLWNIVGPAWEREADCKGIPQSTNLMTRISKTAAPNSDATPACVSVTLTPLIHNAPTKETTWLNMWVWISSPWYPVSNIPPSWMVPWYLGAALLDHLQRARLEAAREEMEEIFHDAFPNMLIIVEKCRSMINVNQCRSYIIIHNVSQ